jgi:hypothetical protein
VFERFPDRQDYIAFQVAKRKKYNLLLFMLEKYGDSVSRYISVDKLDEFAQFWNPSSIPYLAAIIKGQLWDIQRTVRYATEFGSIEIVQYIIDNYPDESRDVRPDGMPPTQELEEFWIERLISLKASNYLLRWIKTPEYCRKILDILEQRGLLENNLSWWIDNISNNWGDAAIWTAAFDFFVKLEWSPDVYSTIWSKYWKSFTIQHMEAIRGWEGKWTAFKDHIIRAVRTSDIKRLEQVENYCRDRKYIDWKSIQKYIDHLSTLDIVRKVLSERVHAAS